MRFVPSEELQLGTVVGRDIIFTAQKTAMLKKGTVLTERYIDYLQERGYLGAYVNDSMSADIEIPETVDQRLFQDSVDRVMDEDISGMLDVSGDIVSDIIKKKEICTDLIDLRSYDDYTYHHCVNVAVLSVVVGNELKLKESELIQLCQAGLLHDIGKTMIPDEILNKPGKLTDEEFKTIKNHSQYSFDIIQDSMEISSLVKQAVLCHHENENGSGYPNGKEGEEISILAKVIHCIDVYDALTSKRTYKDPYEPAKAFEYLKAGIGTQFDGIVVNALVKVIPPYPTGVDVFLTNGERALVIDHSKNRYRPVIRLFKDESTVDLDTDPDYKDISIERSALIPVTEKEGGIARLNEDRSAVKLVKKDIMIVDPSRVIRMQLEGIVEKEAHCKSFETSLDAINYVRNNRAPDLIIIDTDMPVINGMDAVEKMRKAAGSTIPVIFLTAANDSETIIKARMMGRTDYILKPGNPIYIKERIYHALYNLTG